MDTLKKKTGGDFSDKTKIALVGNPNCGKSTLFNALTDGNEYVGNRPGVTVEAKEGLLKTDKNIIIADTPGVYSLSPFSPDEKATMDYLLKEKVDIIVNLTDSRNLKRSLYLTTQIFELEIPCIVALNSFGKNTEIDTDTLSLLLNCNVILISAKNESDALSLINKAISLIGTKKSEAVLFKTAFESETAELEALLTESENKRFYALKILEGDGRALNNSNREKAKRIMQKLEAKGVDTESEIIRARYEFVDYVLSFLKKKDERKIGISASIDKIVLNKYLAFPIFFALIFAVYFFSVSTVGAYMCSVIQKLFGSFLSPLLLGLLEKLGCNEAVRSLFENAFLQSALTVLSFLPQIFLLSFSLTLLEESGYLSRAAFLTDSVFKNSALSGKSLISFLVASSCSVTGIMSARTIENRKSRSLTVTLTPFIPCSAKLTVIALIAQNNFSSSKLAVPFIYLFSFLAVFLSAKLLKNQRYFKDKTSFLLEIPPYSLPSFFGAVKKAFSQSFGFLKKAMGVIFLSSVFLWMLSYFSLSDGKIASAQGFEESLLGMFGKIISPVFAPLGFGDAPCVAALISGLFAKENIIGTLSMFSSSLASFKTADALSFLAFNLFCPPCIVAVSTMKKELGSLKLTAFALFYQTLFAYCLSLLLRLIFSFVLSYL